MAATWATAAKVRERVRQAIPSYNWEDADVEARIERAEKELKSLLTPWYGATEVTAWDTGATRPDILEELTAAIAAIEILKDAYNQDPLQPGTPASIWQAWVDKILEELKTGERRFVLDDGTIILPLDGTSTVYSTTEDREPTFTTRQQTQSSQEPGSLDAF